MVNVVTDLADSQQKRHGTPVPSKGSTLPRLLDKWLKSMASQATPYPPVIRSWAYWVCDEILAKLQIHPWLQCEFTKYSVMLSQCRTTTLSTALTTASSTAPLCPPLLRVTRVHRRCRWRVSVPSVSMTPLSSPKLGILCLHWRMIHFERTQVSKCRQISSYIQIRLCFLLIQISTR